MRFFAIFNLLVLIGLSTQNEIFIKRSILFPLNAISVLKGEVKDPITNELLKISGTVKFEQLDSTSNVTIKVDILGLPKNSVVSRGLHIHAFGIADASDNITAVCGSTGPHFNPFNVTHGYLTSAIRHSGDLGNVMSNEDGSISVVLTNDKISLYDQQLSVIGRSVVLHAAIDDGGLLDTDMSKSTGSSGSRIACGTIGLMKTVGEPTERVLFQMISPSMSDIQDRLKSSWVFDFIQSKMDTLKMNVNDTMENAEDVVDSVRPTIFDLPSLDIFNTLMNSLARDKQVMDTMMEFKRSNSN